MYVMPSSDSLNGHGWVVALGVGVSDGTGVKKTVGRGVLLGTGGRVVAVGSGVRLGAGVHVGGTGTGVAVTARVGLGVGVLTNAIASGSVAPQKSARDGEMKTTV
jgi:hypothetical protein